MGKLSDNERRRIKERNSPQGKVEVAARRAATRAERRFLDLQHNLVREHRIALNNLSTAEEIDRMIARGEKGFNGAEIKPMGVEKHEHKVRMALVKLDSVTGQYDVDD